MGNVCDCCSKAPNNQSGFLNSNDQAEDYKSLIEKKENEDQVYQLSQTPTPLLKDINFAPIDDNDDNNNDTDSSSIDDDQIEELLNEEEEEKEKKQ